MNLSLSPEEARRLAYKFCGPPRVLSDTQLNTLTHDKKTPGPAVIRRPRGRRMGRKPTP